MRLSSYFFLSLSLFLFACGGGGGGGGSSDGLAKNACGELGLGTRIYDGTECANPAGSPIVRIFALGPGGGVVGFCTGSALTQTKILTAAHCFPFGTVTVAVSSGNTIESSQVIEVSMGRVKLHPEYAPLGAVSNAATFNDAAIISLPSKINVSVLPILVSRDLQAGEVISIFGYGTDENGFFDGENLSSGQMRVTSVTVNHVRSDFDGAGSNTCTGDSGGPATFNAGTGAAIVGITSTGINADCGPGDQSLFTNTQGQPVLDFITSQVPNVSVR